MSELRQQDRQNLIVLGVGRKGSGKSRLLMRRYVPHFPRMLTLDQTGEAREAYPHAIEARGLVNVYNAIRELHVASDGKGWHVIAVLDVYEVEALFARLAPPYAGGKPSLSVTLGGVCVECSEVDVIAPANGTAQSITDAIARGRHYRLSLLLATQRPHQCSRMLSSQADEIFSFRMHEPRDLAWLRQGCGAVFARTVTRLVRYHYAHYDSETGEVTHVDDYGRAVCVEVDTDQPDLL